MANNVIGQVMGGSKKVFDGVAKVGEVREKLGLTDQYAASVNGEPADGDCVLDEGDFVSFALAVKSA